MVQVKRRSKQQESLEEQGTPESLNWGIVQEQRKEAVEAIHRWSVGEVEEPIRKIVAGKIKECLRLSSDVLSRCIGKSRKGRDIGRGR